MIDLVLVKKEKMCYVKDVRELREMRRSLSDHKVARCKVRLVGEWFKRREVVIRVMMIKNVKLREHQRIEGYACCIESKKVELGEGRNVE